MEMQLVKLMLMLLVLISKNCEIPIMLQGNGNTKKFQLFQVRLTSAQVWWHCWCVRTRLGPAAPWNIPRSAPPGTRYTHTHTELEIENLISDCPSLHPATPVTLSPLLQVDQQGGDNLFHVSGFPDVDLQLVVHRLADYTLEAADPRHTDPGERAWGGGGGGWRSQVRATIQKHVLKASKHVSSTWSWKKIPGLTGSEYRGRCAPSDTSGWSETQRSRSCGGTTVCPPRCWQTSQTAEPENKTH